jgi:hypothetical protein
MEYLIKGIKESTKIQMGVACVLGSVSTGNIQNANEKSNGFSSLTWQSTAVDSLETVATFCMQIIYGIYLPVIYCCVYKSSQFLINSSSSKERRLLGCYAAWLL